VPSNKVLLGNCRILCSCSILIPSLPPLPPSLSLPSPTWLQCTHLLLLRHQTKNTHHLHLHLEWHENPFFWTDLIVSLMVVVTLCNE
jgi:hypothetical protein